MKTYDTLYRLNAIRRPASLLRLKLISQFTFFVILGVSAAFVFGVLIKHHSEIVVLVAILLAPPLLLLAMLTIPGALANFREFRRHITGWHWLWMILFVSGLVLRVRDVQDIQSSPTDAAAGFRIALVGIVSFVLFIALALRRNDWLPSLFTGLPGALAIYALVSAVSTIWSVFPPWTLYKSLEYLVDVALLAAFLTVIASTKSYKIFLNWTWMLYGLLLGAVWLSACIRPQDGFLRAEAAQKDFGVLPIQLSGVFPSVGANKVGDLGAILGILALSRLLTSSETGNRGLSDRMWYLALFLVSFVSLILAQTRSALAAFLLGVMVLLFCTKRWKTIAALSVAATSLLAIERVREKLLVFLERGQSERDMASLSSRLDWWAYAWHKFMQHPWTGLGAYAAGRFAVMTAVGDSGTSSTHSDYVEILVGTSIWGVLPMVIAILGTWWILIRYLRDPLLSCEDRQLAVEVVAIFSAISFRSLLSTPFTFHAALMFLVIVGYAEFLRRQRKYKLQGAPVKQRFRNAYGYRTFVTSQLQGVEAEEWRNRGAGNGSEPSVWMR